MYQINIELAQQLHKLQEKQHNSKQNSIKQVLAHYIQEYKDNQRQKR